MRYICLKVLKGILYFLWLAISSCILLELLEYLRGNQINSLGISRDIYFMYSEYLLFIPLFYGMVFVCIIFLRWESGAHLHIKRYRIRYSVILLGVFFLTMGAMFASIFSYSYIKPAGIYVRSGFWSRERYYGWEQVDSAYVGYAGAKSDAIRITYKLKLRDGKIIDLTSSGTFWSAIPAMDKLLRTKNIPVTRAAVDGDIYAKLRKTYSDDALVTVLYLYGYEAAAGDEE